MLNNIKKIIFKLYLYNINFFKNGYICKYNKSKFILYNNDYPKLLKY